MESLGIIIMIN